MSKFLVCRLRRSFLCDAESGNDVGAKTLQLNYNVTGSQFCTHFPLRQSEAAVVLMQSDSLHSRTRMRTNYWLCCKHYAFKLSNPCLNCSLQRKSDEIPADFQYVTDILLSQQEKNEYIVEFFISFNWPFLRATHWKIPAKNYLWCCKTACDLHDNCEMTWQTMRDQFS